MDRLQSLIGYAFKNPALLEEALTHASLSKKHTAGVQSNQRLEFLGDAVLQLALSDVLFRLWPTADEGVLSKARSRLVSANALAGLARRLSLGSFLRLDRGEEANGGRDRDSILADAFEAIIGAVFLDDGMTTCQSVIDRLFGEDLAQLQARPEDQNAKGQLQELLQSIDHQAPTYRILETSGPDHERFFVVEVVWNGRSLARGSGRSKKEAEMAAATEALTTRSSWHRAARNKELTDPVNNL
jgi:ribonuclease-3